MLTEHPLLDDSGDKQGSPDPKPDGKNGRIAAVLSLGTPTAAEALPEDPKVRVLYEERRDLERRVEGLKLMKTGMDPERYAAELEKLLTELALKSQQIKAPRVSGEWARRLFLVTIGLVVWPRRRRFRAAWAADRRPELTCRCRATRRTTAASCSCASNTAPALAAAATGSATAACRGRTTTRDGEVHFSKILEELTLLNIRTDGSNILGLDDPELFNYPVAYMAEPGHWGVTPARRPASATTCSRGASSSSTTSAARDWDNLQDQMRGVLPEARWMQLDGTARCSTRSSRFRIRSRWRRRRSRRRFVPSYWGLFENNNPGTAEAVANVNNDISEYWEFSDTGFAPVDLTNEAYKFGVNYVMYALTHEPGQARPPIPPD